MVRPTLTITGRTSSHYTRVTRIFAEELGVEYELEPVLDLLSCDPGDYAGNPALRLPILDTPEGTWFGTSNICHELERRSVRKRSIVWPEQLARPVLANAQELTLQAMSTEVALIMASADGGTEDGRQGTKLRTSLTGSMAWLDAHLSEVLGLLPAGRDLSYLEVTLFCLCAHLEFRELLSIAAYARLAEFRDRWAMRPSAASTPFRVQT